MWERILVIIRKEFRQTLREKRMRVFLIVPPIMQLMLFGFAVNLDLVNSPIAFMDLDQSVESRELLSQFQGSEQFNVKYMPDSDAAVQKLLDHGDAQAVIKVLPGFAREIHKGHTAHVQVLIDGANSNTASILSGYCSQVIQAYGQKLRTGAAPLSAVAVPRVWFNPDLLSRNFFVPGVIMNIITMMTLMLTAMAIVREREIGTMEQLMVTPIRPIELMLGKTLPFVCIGAVQMTLVTTVALLVFHIPFQGRVFTLVFATLIYLMTTLGSGLFLSTVSQTQQQALMSSFFFFTPAFMLSGFSFPIRNMPLPVQWLTVINPMRYFIEILRGIFLKGLGIQELAPQLMALFAIGCFVLFGSALRFHKRLD